jgi:hypothetical protein
MVGEVMQSQADKEALTQKEQAREQSMLTHEGDILVAQSGSDGGKKRKAKSSPNTTVSTLSAEDNFHKTVLESLRMPKELIDIQVLESTKRIELEERKMEHEERRLQLEQTRLQPSKKTEVK